MVVLKALIILIFWGLLGGFLNGIDRVITARMQGRRGPSVFQPFFDVLKLIQKESIEVNTMHRFYVYVSLIFIIFTLEIMMMGGDILLAIFALTLGSIFFVLGGYASRSPYSLIGSERELLQMMAYEPMVLLAGIGLYYVDHSFFIKDILSAPRSSIILVPGIFLGLMYVFTFKLRKSPFDLSMSHHGHQEIVKGITTEYSGKDLAIIEITHWYETIIVLTFVYIFFASAAFYTKIIAVFACAVFYFLEIVIDNASARVKWQLALKSTWIITGIIGTANLILIAILR